jgi:hypothetical protein
MSEATEAPPSRPWVTRTVVGIIAATFFSDVSHEMATAVLPLYLATIGLGPAALGVIEGVVDFLVSLSKLSGGWVGHIVSRKRPWATLGYLITTLAIMAIAFSLASLVTLRGLAWVGRGFRSPLRDYLLADAVEPSHFGRAYGLERAGDMLGAVVGPLLAALLVWGGIEFRTVILWTLIPGLIATGSMFFLTREHEPQAETSTNDSQARSSRFPRLVWFFLVGVLLFGLGDFSRTFVILLAAQALGEGTMTGVQSPGPYCSTRFTTSSVPLRPLPWVTSGTALPRSACSSQAMPSVSPRISFLLSLAARSSGSWSPSSFRASTLRLKRALLHEGLAGT